MKKLIIVCTIMVMVLAMAMPCFANEVELPVLPDGEGKYWYITYNMDVYTAYNTNSSLVPDGTTNVQIQNCNRYELIDNQWVQKNTGFGSKITTGKSVFVYDTSGYLDIVNGIKFKLPIIESDDFMSVIGRFKEQVTVASVVQVLALGATAVVGLVFMWWGVRKLTRGVFSAFRKGKISV